MLFHNSAAAPHDPPCHWRKSLYFQINSIRVFILLYIHWKSKCFVILPVSQPYLLHFQMCNRFQNGIGIWCLCTLVSTIGQLFIFFDFGAISTSSEYISNSVHNCWKDTNTKRNIVGNQKAKFSTNFKASEQLKQSRNVDKQNVVKLSYFRKPAIETSPTYPFAESTQPKCHYTIISSLSVDDRDITKLSSPRVEISKTLFPKVKGKWFQISVWVAQIIRHHWQGSILLESYFSLKRHNPSQRCRKPTSIYFDRSCLTGKLWETEFILLPVLVLVNLHEETEQAMLCPWRRCC